ncbi:hypothetical protein F3Y22_tig00113725pilonHSYRG01060 [Hibiscus syriacus]|uniref:Uncharacterized protein n=1 Tax=Hibiscus syriacus TaxID=106335 RepID=A0A6A2WPB5_HIBSY|nr:hypothetical protein F3Y22_tig00113725pilonHSYRG01060 [Hibiscus syriacus]
MSLQVKDSRNMSFEEPIVMTFGDPHDMSFEDPTVMYLDVLKDIPLEVTRNGIIDNPSTLHILKGIQQPMEISIIKQPMPIKHPPCHYDGVKLASSTLLKVITRMDTKIERVDLIYLPEGDQTSNLFTNNHEDSKRESEEIRCFEEIQSLEYTMPPLEETTPMLEQQTHLFPNIQDDSKQHEKKSQKLGGAFGSHMQLTKNMATRGTLRKAQLSWRSSRPANLS